MDTMPSEKTLGKSFSMWPKSSYRNLCTPGNTLHDIKSEKFHFIVDTIYILHPDISLIFPHFKRPYTRSQIVQDGMLYRISGMER